MSDLLYHLNARDEITFVNEAWGSFARANEGETLLPHDILGRQLWDFIRDVETRHIYRVLHGRVRGLGKPVRLSFRCDGPERRRLLQLDIVAAEAQELIYRVRTLKEEHRPPVRLMDPQSPRSESFVTMCGWCKRVAVAPGRWLVVEQAIDALPLFAEPQPPQLTHGICEECADALHQAMDGGHDHAVLGGF